MTTYTEPNNLKDFLVWEEERGMSREEVTFLSGEDISLAEVVGKVAISCPTTGTAGASNTASTGACGSVTAGADTQLGPYTLTCVAKVADHGTFEVVAPDGTSLPDSTAPTAYVNNQINFTIAVESTDYEVGDLFTIEVTAGSGKYVEVDATAVDGSQNAAGIAIDDYDASDADLAGVIITRDALITTSNLVWPSGATDAQKAAWLADLKINGIITREES